MAKHKLVWEDDFDFDLIGVCSSNSDYKLCWGINRVLDIGLSKGEDYNVFKKKEGECLHSFYEFFNEDTHEEFYLIKNQSFNYKLLIPEQDKIDYFLILKNNYSYEISDLIAKLKQLDSILTAFSFNVDDLKSKSNLVF